MCNNTTTEQPEAIEDVISKLLKTFKESRKAAYEAAKPHKETAKNARKQILKLCPHTNVVQFDYSLPFRICSFCGVKEESWWRSKILVNKENRHVELKARSEYEKFKPAIQDV